LLRMWRNFLLSRVGRLWFFFLEDFALVCEWVGWVSLDFINSISDSTPFPAYICFASRRVARMTPFWTTTDISITIRRTPISPNLSLSLNSRLPILNHCFRLHFLILRNLTPRRFLPILTHHSIPRNLPTKPSNPPTQLQVVVSNPESSSPPPQQPLSNNQQTSK
jgi:hypothetical protein